MCGLSYLLRDGNRNVVHRQSSLAEQILAHVGEGGGRVDRVPAHPIPLQVRGGVATLKLREEKKKEPFIIIIHTHESRGETWLTIIVHLLLLQLDLSVKAGRNDT